jgi:hypothetical protein
MTINLPTNASHDTWLAATAAANGETVQQYVNRLTQKFWLSRYEAAMADKREEENRLIAGAFLTSTRATKLQIAQTLGLIVSGDEISKPLPPPEEGMTIT